MRPRVLVLSIAAGAALAACALDSEGTGLLLENAVDGPGGADTATSSGGTAGAAATGGTQSNGGTRADGGGAVCGDGLIEGDETCDAGTNPDIIGCTSRCQLDAVLLSQIDQASVVASDGVTHYYFVTTTLLDFGSAEVRCRAVGAHLVTVSNAEEQAVVADLGASLSEYWIGARDLTDSLDGLAWWTLEPGATGYEPSGGASLDGGSSEGCVSVEVAPSEGTGENGWHDRPCSDEYASVCEWVVPGSPT
jgi:hypothetical protein